MMGSSAHCSLIERHLIMGSKTLGLWICWFSILKLLANVNIDHFNIICFLNAIIWWTALTTGDLLRDTSWGKHHWSHGVYSPHKVSFFPEGARSLASLPDVKSLTFSSPVSYNWSENKAGESAETRLFGVVSCSHVKITLWFSHDVGVIQNALWFGSCASLLVWVMRSWAAGILVCVCICGQ